MAADEREPAGKHRRMGEAPDGRQGLLRCRDCKAYAFYGSEVCSYCLSEHLEWVSPEEGANRPLGPRKLIAV
jgi:uncharacterized OB-fold protein